MQPEDQSLLLGQRSRSRIRPFFLYRPSSVPDAIAAFELSGGGRKAAYMAGGIDLIDDFKNGFRCETVIYLAGIEDLDGIAERNGDLVIGATVTHEQFAADRVVARIFPALAKEWSCLANPRIRAVGTLGGNLMAKNSNYDAIAVAIAADADLRFAQRSGVVTRKADEPCEPSDLLLDIRIKHAIKRRIAVNRRFRPIVAFALSTYEGDFGCEFRLAANMGFLRPSVASVMTHAVTLGLRDAAAFAHELVEALPSPIDDWRASASYRQHLLKTLVKRELAAQWCGDE
jgi:aerobic carbon-monoxide dehydrogenase medium subunit